MSISFSMLIGTTALDEYNNKYIVVGFNAGNGYIYIVDSDGDILRTYYDRLTYPELGKKVNRKVSKRKKSK